jgi:regulator of protease activity HflC (stomatin/prohibitin superfamily)
MGACFAIVAPDQIGAYEVLGKFQNVMRPGIHFTLPWGQVRKLSTRLQSNTCITETKTKDNVFVKIHVVVQQEVSQEANAKEAFYRLTNPAQQIDSFIGDVVRSFAPSETLDELFQEKDKLASECKMRLVEKMKEYGYIIHQVLVVDIAPDAGVKNAMNQRFAQEKLRAAAEAKAEADYAISVKAAEAEAMSKELQGRGIAAQRLEIVQGLKKAVGNAQMDHKQVTEIMLMTQYLDTLEKLANGPATTVFVPQAVGLEGMTRDGMVQSLAMKK